MINYLYILVTIILFSTIEVAVKSISEPVSPLLLLFIRFFTAGAILLMISFGKIKQLTKNDFLYMLFMGVIGVTMAFSAFHTSLLYLKASTAAVIFSVNPIYSSIAASLILKEKLKIKTLLAMLISIAGIYIINFGASIPKISGAIGPLLMTAASKKVTVKYGSVLPTAISFIFGSLVLIPFIHGFSVIANLDRSSILLIIYLALGATALAYICYFKGLKELPVSAGTMLFFIKPPLASILAMILLHEQLTMNFFIGFSIIIVSIYLSLLSKNQLEYLLTRRA